MITQRETHSVAFGLLQIRIQIEKERVKNLNSNFFNAQIISSHDDKKQKKPSI